MRSRLARTGTLISQTANVWFFNGNPDESISARSYREGFLNNDAGWERRRKYIDWLAKPFETDHCHKAYLTDLFHAETYRKMMPE
jgi:hypothetical protein